MKITTKKIIIGLVIVLALVAIYGYSKAKTLLSIFDKMTIEPVGISNVDASFDRVKFNIDILLTNPTAEDFSVSGYGLASLDTISIFYDGIYLATSSVKINEISVPANDKLLYKKIPVEIPQFLDFLSNNLVLVGKLITDVQKQDISKFSTTGTISVAGQTIEI